MGNSYASLIDFKGAQYIYEAFIIQFGILLLFNLVYIQSILSSHILALIIRTSQNKSLV